MERKTIDKFIKKLSLAIQSQVHARDLSVFTGLKNECIKLLEQLSRKPQSHIEGVRNLGCFKIAIKHLLEVSAAEKKEPELLQQIELHIKPMVDFLELKINVLEIHIHLKGDTSVDYRSEYTWTDNKSDLIEVLQSILLMGSINHGKVKNKEAFILYIGRALNVDLKNHSGLFNDILNRYDDPNREHSRAFYLLRMIQAFSRKLTELDNFNSKKR